MFNEEEHTDPNMEKLLVWKSLVKTIFKTRNDNINEQSGESPFHIACGTKSSYQTFPYTAYKLQVGIVIKRAAKNLR